VANAPQPPAFRDLLHLARGAAHGGIVDRPRSVLRALLEMPRMTAPGSPRTMRQIAADPEIRGLSTPELAVGDEAFDFELPRYDFSGGGAEAAGSTVRLSAFRGRRPVVLIFGSYT
jgi:hypothetical protein